MVDYSRFNNIKDEDSDDDGTSLGKDVKVWTGRIILH